MLNGEELIIVARFTSLGKCVGKVIRTVVKVVVRISRAGATYAVQRVLWHLKGISSKFKRCKYVRMTGSDQVN